MKAWLVGTVPLGALLMATLLVNCQKAADEVPVKQVLYKGPTVETENVLMLVSDSARLRIRLTAPLEQQFESGDMIYPKGVKLTFLDDEGVTVVNTITGRYGKFDKAKNLYTMRGDVRVTNVPKQQRMNTEEAFYDKTKASIYTQEQTEIRVTTPTEVLTGRGLTANQDFSLYRILNPTGVFTLQNAPTAAPATPTR
ncbi:LPS export ABC transporter periplasmic protein LptC [Hymenobacter endophyticus]|uniref:LPS export ABC transporter periplasmic protein LptC n=1 Tax=Hymenobacter endophyticus TaxID=3076335 RepID=A0ABU3TLD7_9BACT|nr:LPS export ABC transporter periplasmic protein LptC [Hymenobacter endophyticus]MDU0372196.1 LPS export ABC transporter periplasmic protein LptC [Hymenobacter endophyticus]